MSLRVEVYQSELKTTAVFGGGAVIEAGISNPHPYPVEVASLKVEVVKI